MNMIIMKKKCRIIKINSSTVNKSLKRLKQAQNFEKINGNKRVGKGGR